MADAVFRREAFGAMVATILETADVIVEVLVGEGKTYALIVHNRVGETDRFEDMTANLTAEQFRMLGSVADRMAPPAPPVSRGASRPRHYRKRTTGGASC